MEEPSEANRLLQLQLRTNRLEKLGGFAWDGLHTRLGECIQDFIAAVAPDDKERAWLEVVLDEDLSSGDKIITYKAYLRDGG